LGLKSCCNSVAFSEDLGDEISTVNAQRSHLRGPVSGLNNEQWHGHNAGQEITQFQLASRPTHWKRRGRGKFVDWQTGPSPIEQLHQPTAAALMECRGRVQGPA